MGLPANLYRRPDGRFVFRDPRTGKSHAMGRDVVSAKAQAAEANVHLANLTRKPRLVHRLDGSSTRTLGAWLAEWQKETEASEDIAWATKRQYRSNNKQLSAALGDRVLTELAPPDIAEVIKRWGKDDGKPTKAKQMLGHLRQACDAAIAAGWLPVGQNPTAGLKAGKVTVKRQRLTFAQFKSLHEIAVKHYEPWLASWLELELLTALRLNDSLGVQFRESKGATAWVERDVLCCIIDKTDMKAQFPLDLYQPKWGPRTLREVIADCRKTNIVTPFVIHHSRHGYRYRVGRKVTKNTVNEHFTELVERAGIKVAAGATPPTPHELRSLSLRLYNEAFGTEFAKALGTHKSDQSAATYQDKRGAEWHVIPLPTAAKSE